MSEAGSIDFEPTFNRSIKVRSRDDRITSNAGALLLREADHRLGLVESLARRIHDPRKQEWVRYFMPELLRERLYSIALNYRASDDVDLLAHDAVLRMAVWDRPGERVLEERLASQPTQSRLLDILARFKCNLEAVREALSDWVERHLRGAGKDHGVLRGTIDVDGMAVVTHGQQPGAAYNGYYKDTIYYPLVAGFTSQGDYDSARVGNGFVPLPSFERGTRPRLAVPCGSSAMPTGSARAWGGSSTFGWMRASLSGRSWIPSRKMGSVLWEGSGRMRSSNAWPSPL